MMVRLCTTAVNDGSMWDHLCYLCIWEFIELIGWLKCDILVIFQEGKYRKYDELMCVIMYAVKCYLRQCLCHWVYCKM